MAWAISHPAVHVAIVGARLAAHLTDTVAAADVELSQSDRQEIDRILAEAAPLRGPSPEGV